MAEEITVNNITIRSRDVTSLELERVNAGCDENAVRQGVEVQISERFGTVALDGELFVGAASGFVYGHGNQYNGWFFLADLFVEEPYRRRGIGKNLLQTLEENVQSRGINKIWMWTAGHEGPAFYRSLGYVAFAELEKYYSDGGNRIAFRKQLTARAEGFSANNIAIHSRDMTSLESERVAAGFEENTVRQGVIGQSDDRFGTVALDGELFVGAASGLACRNGNQYNGWFRVTDLFVEEPYRRRGIGRSLLQTLEENVQAKGIHTIWAWTTAGHEGPAYYQGLGYEAFAELEKYYSDGGSRIAFRKQLTPKQSLPNKSA